MKRARWQAFGPYGPRRMWLVQNDAAVFPELTRKWFDTRTEARAYVKKMKGRSPLRRRSSESK